MNKKILIITPQFVKDVCLDQMANLLKERNYDIKIVVYKDPLNEDEMIPLIKDVDGYTFASGFVAGMIRYGEITAALKLASANASSVVRYFGAKPGLLVLEEAEELIREKEGEDVYYVRKTGLGEFAAVGMRQLFLRVDSDAGAVEAAVARPRGFHVWNADVTEEVTELSFPPPGEPLGPVRIAAVRGMVGAAPRKALPLVMKLLRGDDP